MVCCFYCYQKSSWIKWWLAMTPAMLPVATAAAKERIMLEQSPQASSPSMVVCWKKSTLMWPASVSSQPRSAGILELCWKGRAAYRTSSGKERPSAKPTLFMCPFFWSMETTFCSSMLMLCAFNLAMLSGEKLGLPAVNNVRLSVRLLIKDAIWIACSAVAMMPVFLPLNS